MSQNTIDCPSPELHDSDSGFESTRLRYDLVACRQAILSVDMTMMPRSSDARRLRRRHRRRCPRHLIPLTPHPERQTPARRAAIGGFFLIFPIGVPIHGPSGDNPIVEPFKACHAR